MNQITTRKPSALERFKKNLEVAAPSIQEVLPRHVDIDRFKRIVASGVANNPDLQRAANENPSSILRSALQCAKDGLLPDGREAAFVVFNTRVKDKNGGKDTWAATAQYMPMIGGILKMMRQSGEVLSLSAQVVYEKDEFDYELGDNERITHKPLLQNNRGEMVAAYAVLKTKDGGIYRELMGRDQIMAVKSISKTASKGPWSGPFESEMWKKTVLRRLAKRAPISTDVIDLIQRDDDMYDLQDVRALPEPKPRTFDMATGEIIEQEVEAEPADHPNDPLEGDDLPDDIQGSPVEAEEPDTDDATAEDPPANQAEPETEPKPEPVSTNDVADDEDIYTKFGALSAIKKASSEAVIDEIMDACSSCSWWNGKGNKTTIEMGRADRLKKLKAEAEEARD